VGRLSHLDVGRRDCRCRQSLGGGRWALSHQSTMVGHFLDYKTLLGFEQKRLPTIGIGSSPALLSMHGWGGQGMEHFH